MQGNDQNKEAKADGVVPEEPNADGSGGASPSQEELEQALTQASEYKDRYLRAAAEMDNMRRRMEKERTELLQYGLDKVMNDVLPVLDSFDKALSDVGESDQSESVHTGMELVHKQLVTVLEKHGLKKLDAEKAKFDPNFHQAIQKIDKEDAQEETVLDVFQDGYTLNGRLVRPAMVSVAVPKTGSKDESSDE